MTNITLPRETLQQAIDALDNVQEFVSKGYRKVDPALTALRTALEAPNPPHECKTEAEKIAFAFGWWKALEVNRAAPAAREPLTDEQIEVMHTECTEWQRMPHGILLLARAIEAAHGIGKEQK